MNPFLHATLVEIESHVATDGWDQPTRFYALVETAALLRAQPALVEQLQNSGISAPPAFTPVEQEAFPEQMPLDEVLAQVTWGEQVAGCAIAVERLILPADAEVTIEHDSPEMPAYVAAHPQREEIRLVACVLRNGTSDVAIRMRSKDTADEVLFGPELAPGMCQALLRTFAASTEDDEDAPDGPDGAEHAHENGHGHGHGH